MLYLVGLGLGGIEDITVRGLNIIKQCSKLYLDAYTSLLCSATQEDLEKFYGKPIILADRTMVEQNADEILQYAKTGSAAFLVVGDPLGATTHVDMILRAKQLGIGYEVVHNASIMTSVGCTGLQLYSFGQCVTICMEESDLAEVLVHSFRRVSYFERICSNRAQNLHTLCLLDLKVKELSVEDLARGRNTGRYLPPRFLRANDAAAQLLAVRDAYKRQIDEAASGKSELQAQDLEVMRKCVDNFDKSTICVAVARCGGPTQKILACSAAEMSAAGPQLGDPLHTLVVTASHLHPLETDMLRIFGPDQSSASV